MNPRGARRNSAAPLPSPLLTIPQPPPSHPPAFVFPSSLSEQDNQVVHSKGSATATAFVHASPSDHMKIKPQGSPKFGSPFLLPFHGESATTDTNGNTAASVHHRRFSQAPEMLLPPDDRFANHRTNFVSLPAFVRISFRFPICKSC
uniref:Uncharacterized protein n=1 Tax=Lactuca sativa TaxID=4236 RepID=A0A9R1WKB6_LACSA|nr:hypothetical protein LSAT_V11C200057210 [Lactuca sativa]